MWSKTSLNSVYYIIIASWLGCLACLFRPYIVLAASKRTMASVLEKRERKTFLDDTIPLTPTITTHRMEVTGKQSHAVSIQRSSLCVVLTNATCLCVCRRMW